MTRHLIAKNCKKCKRAFETTSIDKEYCGKVKDIGTCAEKNTSSKSRYISKKKLSNTLPEQPVCILATPCDGSLTERQRQRLAILRHNAKVVMTRLNKGV